MSCSFQEAVFVSLYLLWVPLILFQSLLSYDLAGTSSHSMEAVFSADLLWLLDRLGSGILWWSLPGWSEIQFPLLSCVWSSHFGLLQTPGTISPLLPSSMTTLAWLELPHAQRPFRGSLWGVLSPYCWPSYTLPTRWAWFSHSQESLPKCPPHKESQIPPSSTFRLTTMCLTFVTVLRISFLCFLD